MCYFGQQPSDRPHSLPGVFVGGGRRHPAQDPPRLCLCQFFRRLQQRRARDELAELCIQPEPLRVRQLGQHIGPQRAGDGHVGRHQVVGRQERAEQQLLAELFLALIPAADQSADRSEYFRKRPQVEVQVLSEQGDRSHGPLAELRAIGRGSGTGGAPKLVAYDGAQCTSDALARGHVADPVVTEVLHEQHGIVPRTARQQVAQKLQPLVVAADDVSKGIGVQFDGARRLSRPPHGHVLSCLAGQGHDPDLLDRLVQLCRPCRVPIFVLGIDGHELRNQVLQFEDAPAHEQRRRLVQALGGGLAAGQPKPEELGALMDAESVDQIDESLVVRVRRKRV